jgi:PAS domain S-box-containing protein
MPIKFIFKSRTIKGLAMEICVDANMPPRTGLRCHSEERLSAKTTKLHLPRTNETMQRLVHELEVHQIELEIQNEELYRAQEEIESSRDKYAELYDFAPVGYFTFDTRGLIREVNLSGAKLLGLERQMLVDRLFSSFIADADGREAFSRHLERVVQRQDIQKCEIRLTGNDGTEIHGQLQSVTVGAIESKDGYILSSIVDGTAAKQLETEIQDARNYAESIVETVRKPLVVLNSDLKVLSANRTGFMVSVPLSRSQDVEGVGWRRSGPGLYHCPLCGDVRVSAHHLPARPVLRPGSHLPQRQPLVHASGLR